MMEYFADSFIEDYTSQKPKIGVPYILVANDAEGKRGILLKSAIYSVGRSLDCSICLIDPHVSRIHAYLRRVDLLDGDVYYLLIDEKCDRRTSRNGTFVNDERVGVRMLKSGDFIRFGTSATAKFLTPEMFENSELDALEKAHKEITHKELPLLKDGTTTLTGT